MTLVLWVEGSLVGARGAVCVSMEDGGPGVTIWWEG